MKTVVLALVIIMGNGNVYMTARGERDNPETFSTVQACEKQQKQDEIDLAPELKKKKEIEQWFLQCMETQSYLNTIKNK